MKLTRVFVMILTALTVFPFLFGSCKKPPQEDPQPTGTTELHEPTGAVKSVDLVSFTAEFIQEGMYETGHERSLICRPGRYAYSLAPDESGTMVCSMRYRSVYNETEPVTYAFPVAADVLTSLQKVLEDSGIAEQNGFYGWNSALGTFVDIVGTYASGEKLTVYGEGGVSAAPPCDVDALTVFFNRIAREHGYRFTEAYSLNEAQDAFLAYLSAHIDWADAFEPHAEALDQEMVDIFVDANDADGNVRDAGWCRINLVTGKTDDLCYYPDPDEDPVQYRDGDCPDLFAKAD